MVLFPQVALNILSAGGGLRISASGLFPQTMIDMASAARSGNARLTFVVGDVVLFPQTMIDVAAAGGGQVAFDVT